MPKPKAAAFGFWLCASGALALGAQGQPEPGASSAPAAAGPEGSLERVKAAHARSVAGQGMRLDWAPEAPLSAWLPRFEEHVEVRPRTLADAAARHLEGFDPVNGPATSAPNVQELRNAADHQLAKGADFLALIAGLYKLGQYLVRGTPAPRYFLYLVKRGASLEPLLREGRMPAEALYGPGVSYELVAEFAKFDDARRAADRMRQKLLAQQLLSPATP